MATQWLLKSCSSTVEAPPGTSRRNTIHSEDSEEHDKQFNTKFYDATEEINETVMEGSLPEDHQHRAACESCSGSSRCLNLQNTKENDISWGLKPLILVGICAGFIHRRKNGCCTRSPSCMVASFCVVFLWVNFIRYFLNYSDSTSYGSKLFMKMSAHCWYLQVSVSHTLFFFHISPGLKSLFSTWNRYNLQYHCNTAKHVRSRAIYYLAIVFIPMIILTAAAIGVLIYDDPYNPSGASKFVIDLPNMRSWSIANLRIAQAIFAALGGYSVMMWIGPITFFLAIISGLKFNYHEISAMNYRTMTTHQLEQARRRHQNLCSIVLMADNLFSCYSFLVYMTNMPMICFTIYNFAFRQMDDSNLMEMVLFIFHIISLSFQLLILTTSAASLSTKAIAPQEQLFEVQYDVDDSLCNIRGIQVMLFINRLSNSHIGFTAWKLLNITRGTIMTVATMIISYVFVLFKFGLTLEPLSASNCTTGH